MRVLNSTLEAIGNTPIVRLRRVVRDSSATVLVKLEYFNPTGSYKDRMARSIIEEAERRGDLKAGMTVIECTGGSTGSSLAFVCAQKGYPLKIVSSDAFAVEKLRTIAAFGAELILEPSVDGQITPDLIPRMMERAKQIGESEGAYLVNQFYNEDALVGYRGIAEELRAQIDGRIDVFCGGVGTAGMISGVSRALREFDTRTEIVGIEPDSAPMLSEGRKGSHRVEGIGVGFVPPLLQEDDLNRVLAVSEGEAREMALRLAREEGIFAGTSSAMNVVGALRLAREFGAGYRLVTVAVDSGMKYLAGDLFSGQG